MANLKPQIGMSLSVVDAQGSAMYALRESLNNAAREVLTHGG